MIKELETESLPLIARWVSYIHVSFQRKILFMMTIFTLITMQCLVFDLILKSYWQNSSLIQFQYLVQHIHILFYYLVVLISFPVAVYALTAFFPQFNTHRYHYYMFQCAVIICASIYFWVVLPIGLNLIPVGFVHLAVVLCGFFLFERKEIYFAVKCITFFLLLAITMISFNQSYDGYIYTAPLTGLNPEAQKLLIFKTLFFIVPQLVLLGIVLFQNMYFWQQRKDKLVLLSKTDTLTGLNNRRAIQDHLEELIQSYAEQPETFTVILADVDYFKRVNDEVGHMAGDYVLIELARLLKHNIRKKDAIGRIGGEEFLIVLRATSDVIADEVAERCRLAIENHIFSHKSLCLNITCSFGVYTFTSVYPPNLEMILKCVDRALYQAKNTGRNKVCHFQDE